jgi:hypothetical protein
MKTIKPKTHEELIKLHGRKGRCKIKGDEVDDMKICVENDEVYVCQNVADGQDADDKLGYKYSWCISEPDYNYRYEDDNVSCTDIEVYPEERIVTWENLQVGDIVKSVNHEGRRQIQGICGRVYFVSVLDDFGLNGPSFTLQELQNKYTIVQPPKPNQKLTRAEIREAWYR